MRHAALALMAVLVWTPAVHAQVPDRLTVDHVIDMARVGDPELSPDGRQVLYTVAELDWSENKRNTRLWIANADGSDARMFTSADGDGSARWSPDGRWVSFLRSAEEDNGGEGRQLWLIRTDGGEARQLTKHPTAVRSYEWTRDGSRIVFMANDSLPKAERDARKKGADAIFVNEGPNGQTRGDWSNLWWVPVDLEDNAARPITEGERIVGGFAVSPDGGRVAYTFRTENRRNDGNLSEIALVDLASREIRVLTDNNAPESGLTWLPDGRSLLFQAPDLHEWELAQGNLYVMELASGAIRQLMEGSDLNIRATEFSPDGRYLDFTALERTVTSFYRLDLRNGRVTKMSDWVGGVGSPSWSRDRSVVAFTAESPTSPAEVYTARYRPGMSRTAVTDGAAPVRALALVEPEVIRWRSFDGLEIEGLLYHPVGGRSHAGGLVLHIHGGPAGVFSRGFDADAQVLAAQGWAILQPNVRGSTGYGDALLRGNMNDIGGGDYHDLITGVDQLIEQGIAHPDSLAVKGWSYGGILGGWTITRTDRFQAASLGAMVSDWVSEFGVGFNHDVRLWYLGGDPWSNRDHWVERSAYTHADRVTTPTILFHGDRDDVDTPGQSMNFHAALLHHGVPTRYVLFPREPHGIREPRHHRTRLVEELRWFEMHVRGNPDWEAPARPAETTEDPAAAEEAVAGS
jgi:dipeptidyl aminopeptidase/acylaminoacyl peptidase